MIRFLAFLFNWIIIAYLSVLIIVFLRDDDFIGALVSLLPVIFCGINIYALTIPADSEKRASVFKWIVLYIQRKTLEEKEKITKLSDG